MKRELRSEYEESEYRHHVRRPEYRQNSELESFEPRPYGPIKHKPYCPLYEGNLEERNNTFSGAVYEYTEVKKYENEGGYSNQLGREEMGRRNLTLSAEKKRTISSTLEGGDNYNYYESKNIKKKKKRNMPVTIHHRREDLGAYIDDIPERLHHRDFTYTKRLASQISSNLNNLNKTYRQEKQENIRKSYNMPKQNLGSSENTRESKVNKTTTYQTIKTTLTSANKSRNSGSGGLGIKTSYSGYKKYNEGGKVGSIDISKYLTNQSTSNYKSGLTGGVSKSLINQRSSSNYKIGGTSGLSKYQTSTNYKIGGTSGSKYKTSTNYKSGDTSGLKKYQTSTSYRIGDTSGSKYQTSTNYKSGGSSTVKKYQSSINYKSGGTSGTTKYQTNPTDNYGQRRNNYSNNEEKYKYTETKEYRYGSSNTGRNFSSEYQYLDDDDDEYEVIYCPVHGKQTVKKRRNLNNY